MSSRAYWSPRRESGASPMRDRRAPRELSYDPPLRAGITLPPLGLQRPNFPASLAFGVMGKTDLAVRAFFLPPFRLLVFLFLFRVVFLLLPFPLVVFVVFLFVVFLFFFGPGLRLLFLVTFLTVFLRAGGATFGMAEELTCNGSKEKQYSWYKAISCV